MRVSNPVMIERNLKFGVEIEMCNDVRRDLIRIAASKGVNIVDMGYTHRVTEGCWKIVFDSSCGYELVSPILYSLDEMKLVCEALKEAGAEVNKKCGLHIHHDGADFEIENIKNVYRLYHKYRKVFDSIMPKSRRGDSNVFCRDIDSAWMERVERATTIVEAKKYLTNNEARSVLRYRKVNFCSYLSYKTIEFRQHSGTTEYEKIANWVLITHLIMQAAKESKKIKGVTTARAAKWNGDEKHIMFDFNKELGIGGTDVANYVRGRRKHFKEV